MSIQAKIKQARGLPLFDDQGPWLELVDASATHDFRALDDDSLRDRAKAFRASSRTLSGERDGDPAALPSWRKPSAPRPAIPRPPSPAEAGRRLEALALAREAARRALGLEPFASQLVAALAMGSGFVAELPTGEGKTLAAGLAAAAEALCATKVHIFTANDYLARRDAAWMEPLYRLLGLRGDSVTAADPKPRRAAAWRADIVHSTAIEAGFDFLRDGLAADPGELLVPSAGLCLVDEADFILLDEARVPLVIAAADKGAGTTPEAEADGIDARAADGIAQRLSGGVHWQADRRNGQVRLTGEGASALEDLGLAPLSRARVHAALHARVILRRDVDYLVRDGKARPLDAFTGRVAERRRWPWGVQAAIEAAEGLEPGPEGRIFGMLTIEHLAALYPRLGAMTATAGAAAEDFALMYGLATLVVRPHVASRREDKADAIYRTRGAAIAALAAEAAGAHRAGRPVLVGTASVPESEEVALALADALGDPGAGVTVLNARNDEAEAAVIAGAGGAGRVTVSTNMSGRGVDIRLGPGVAEAGGLCVLGLGRRHTRREEDQLRGRAGRQGDPGSSRFFASLEDPQFTTHGVPDFLPRRLRASPPDGLEIADRGVIREIARAQSIIANQERLQRTALRKFSLILEFDRRAIRALRDSALVGRELPDAVEEALGEAAARGGAAAGQGPGSGRPSHALRDTAVAAFIRRLDLAWAAHLALVEELREGAGLLRYGGLDPGMEYARRSADAFEKALDEAIGGTAAEIRDGAAARSGPGGGEEARAGQGGEAAEARPDAFWTYVMEAEELEALPVLGAAGLDLGAAIARAASALVAAVAGLNPRACPRGTSGRSSGGARGPRS